MNRWDRSRDRVWKRRHSLGMLVRGRAIWLSCLLILLNCGWGSGLSSPPAHAEEGEHVVLLIHGGAGIRRANLSEEQEIQARQVLEQAVRAGHAVLKQGGSSLDAVQAAIMVLEDAPEFNAGRGSVLNSTGQVEMDASIMDGSTRDAGAVAAVTAVQNPIALARLVMTDTPHVLMIGAGAEQLGRQHQLEFKAPEWFITPAQQERLQRVQSREVSQREQADATRWIGTVGAVALDQAGHLAAGTSTGGLVNKRPGRVGDSPIIGAGTYAEDGVCAVSCTGHGEYFIRNVIAHEVAARMKHGRVDLDKATRDVIHELLNPRAGAGGLIALDARGQMRAVFNTEGMFHAWVTSQGKIQVSIFKESAQ
jgi:L-asparaginase / beta-aspartyl-peptidase